MLPLPNSASSSPNSSSGWAHSTEYREDKVNSSRNHIDHSESHDDNHKRHHSFLHTIMTLLRQFKRDPTWTQARKLARQISPSSYKYVAGFVVILLVLLGWWRWGSEDGALANGRGLTSSRGYARSNKNGRDARGIRQSSPRNLNWRQLAEPVNWGDHVGLGRARQLVLERTPALYVDIGDGGDDGPVSGTFYRARRTLDEILADEELLTEDPKKALSKDSQTGTVALAPRPHSRVSERDRHGVLGGACTEWSSGIVGTGEWLGDQVDMRKEQSISNSDQGRNTSRFHTPERKALVDHILDWGWVYLDEEDKTNTAKLLKSAKAEGWWDKLPLRDQVRDDPVRMKTAAVGWSRAYTPTVGQWRKSALEIQLERMVRRHPIVVFSKTTCPHSRRAKAFLKDLRLTPAPKVVEVDLRPDIKALSGLLKRRTHHSTFPNIVIGGRSIGGADDLEELAKDGHLDALLKEVQVERSA